MRCKYLALLRRCKNKDRVPYCLVGVSILAIKVGDSSAPQIVSELARVVCEPKPS